MGRALLEAFAIIVAWKVVQQLYFRITGRPKKNERLVLLALREPGWWGTLELNKVTGVRAGYIYASLEELEKKGWIERRQEEVSTDALPRTFYRLTPQGIEGAADRLRLDKQWALQGRMK